MSIDKINSWLTLTANIGVVLGIVFLGIEIQQSRIATEGATYLARSTEIQESNQNFALSEFLPEIYEKLETEGIESLGKVEFRRIRAWEAARNLRMESQIQQSNLGLLDNRTRNDVLRAAANLLPLWESLGININTPFLEAITNRPLD